jgi:uncharacterized membrane protein (GlpM family)
VTDLAVWQGLSMAAFILPLAHGLSSVLLMQTTMDLPKATSLKRLMWGVVALIMLDSLKLH